MAVAQRRSLKAASADLNLSPSALSRRVQALETHVGRRVFDRTGGEFRLTTEGRVLLEEVTPAFDGLSQALERMREDARDTVTIGVMPAFANAWLLPRLARFKAAHPHIDVVLDTSPSPVSRLSSGLDGAIVIAEQGDPGLYGRRLCQQMLLAVCAPNLLDGAKPLRTLADVLRHPVLLHRRMPEMLETWLAGVGIDRPGQIERYDSGPLLLEAATLGLGVAIVFDTMVPAFLASGRLVRPFDENVLSPLNYWFFCREPALARRPLKRFHDWLFEEVVASAPLPPASPAWRPAEAGR